MSIKFKSPFLFNPAHSYTLGFWGFGVIGTPMVDADLWKREDIDRTEAQLFR